MQLRKKFQHMIGNSFDGDHRKTVEQKGRVSFIDAENTIIERSSPDESPSSLYRNSVDQLEPTRMGSSSRTGIGYRRYRPSSRTESLAKPLVRFGKPLKRLSAVFRGNKTLARL